MHWAVSSEQWSLSAVTLFSRTFPPMSSFSPQCWAVIIPQSTIHTADDTLLVTMFAAVWCSLMEQCATQCWWSSVLHSVLHNGWKELPLLPPPPTVYLLCTVHLALGWHCLSFPLSAPCTAFSWQWICSWEHPYAVHTIYPELWSVTMHCKLQCAVLYSTVCAV